jgi:hypothetical protein
MSSKTVPLTHKGPHSVGYPEDKADAFQKERYTLTFDFETNRADQYKKTLEM